MYSLNSGYTGLSGNMNPASAAQMQSINGESGGFVSGLGGTATYGNLGYVMMFPVLTDITNIFYSGRTISSAQVSVDTTNGVDGTWSNITVTNKTFSAINARTQIDALAGALGIKAFRWISSGGFSNTPALWAVHLYGGPSAVTDRLEFWHPTLDQSLRQTPAWLDWGNRPRGTTDTRQVRIKNRSTVLSANNVTVGIEALTDANPTFVSQHTFSIGGSAPAPTVTIPSLAPGTVSDVITITQALTASAALSLWWQRFYANAGSWV